MITDKTVVATRRGLSWLKVRFIRAQSYEAARRVKELEVELDEAVRLERKSIKLQQRCKR